MAVGVQRKMTVEEFDRFVMQPENAERLYEYIGGEIVLSPSNPYGSQIASRINGFIFIYLTENPIGHLTGEAGGYVVSGERYAPDVAFISKEKQRQLVRQGYNPNPPDLAVEVISPSDNLNSLRIKLSNYLAAGTVVWVVEPEKQVVEIHAPGQPAQVIGRDGKLSGGEVLPGFELTVSAIFPEEQDG